MGEENKAKPQTLGDERAVFATEMSSIFGDSWLPQRRDDLARSLIAGGKKLAHPIKRAFSDRDLTTERVLDPNSSLPLYAICQQVLFGEEKSWREYFGENDTERVSIKLSKRLFNSTDQTTSTRLQTEAHYVILFGTELWDKVQLDNAVVESRGEVRRCLDMVNGSPSEGYIRSYTASLVDVRGLYGNDDPKKIEERDRVRRQDVTDAMRATFRRNMLIDTLNAAYAYRIFSNGDICWSAEEQEEMMSFLREKMENFAKNPPKRNDYVERDKDLMMAKIFRVLTAGPDLFKRLIPVSKKEGRSST